MVLLSRVLTGAGFAVIMLSLLLITGCNRDQSSTSQTTSSTSTPASDTAQSSPAAVTESSTATDTSATGTSTAATPSTTTSSTAPSTTGSTGAGTTSSTAASTAVQTGSGKAGPENYNQVKVGMTSKEVTDIIGKASKIKQEGQTTEWEYYLPQGGKFELRLQNDKVISAGRH